jgi:hypothetical protein
MGESNREPIESMRDALDLIEDLDEKIEKLEEFLAEIIRQGMAYGECRCGNWELWSDLEKSQIMKRVKELDAEVD